MDDLIEHAMQTLVSERTKSLWEKFPGYHRAVVVETNDPLNMGRIRFKCPEMHDFDLKPGDCPWAVSAFGIGGLRACAFAHPCIGDIVWITFEKQHAYAPIWVGFADPTRKNQYTLPQVTQKTPVGVNDSGDILPDNGSASGTKDYDENYLPKDGRPMSHGYSDRYGNMDISSYVGFYPVEHDVSPPLPDNDALQNTQFTQAQAKPLMNQPDRKYQARITKYGCMFVASDQGYHWRKEQPAPDSGGTSGGGSGSTTNVGEFYGDFKKDAEFEKKRWLYLQRLINEDSPGAGSQNSDCRRMEFKTRYGSRIEIRDTGWAQAGPIKSSSRNEFGSFAQLSDELTNDFRWIKFRTKGGMLFQAYDKGFDPASDKFVTRDLIDECGAKSEQEDIYWGDRRDARWMRLVTRYGFKFVLDDRGSSTTDANNQENPRGNGVLLKGRRTGSSKGVSADGVPVGFYLEFNENDLANHTTWGTPLGQVAELNDRYQYAMIAAGMGRKWGAPWKGLKENEFIRKPLMLQDPENSTHHLKLDHDNEYIRLKTRAGRGESPDNPINESGVVRTELNQGLEARDGKLGMGPWVELVDCQHRGLWFSKQQNLSIWRSMDGIEMYEWFDDDKHKIVIYNGEDGGTIDLYSVGDITIQSAGKVIIQGSDITFKSDKAITFEGGGTTMSVAAGGVTTSGTMNASQFNGVLPGVAAAGPAGGSVGTSGAATTPVTAASPPTVPQYVEPNDRGVTYNGPFVECPVAEVEHIL